MNKKIPHCTHASGGKDTKLLKSTYLDIHKERRTNGVNERMLYSC